MPNPNETAGQIATKSPKKTFEDLIQSDNFKAQLQNALPKHLTPDRFIRLMLTAALKTPLLLQCTQDSLFLGMLNCAAAGLEIDGRRAHLIPFKNNKKGCYEAQLIIDYKGLAEVILRSGQVSSIHADVIHENDEFEYNMGQILKHKINFKEERGEPYAAYCRITMHDGTFKDDVMQKSDIDRIRRRSRSSNDGPWVTDPMEMWKKTVFRRASKWVPQSPEIAAAAREEADDDAIDVESKKVDFAGILGAPGQEQLPGDPADKTIGAPLETTATEVASAAPTTPEKTPDKPKAPPVEKYTPEQRKEFIDIIETAILDGKVTEKRLFDHAINSGFVPQGIDQLFDMPTGALLLVKLSIGDVAKNNAT